MGQRWPVYILHNLLTSRPNLKLTNSTYFNLIYMNIHMASVSLAYISKLDDALYKRRVTHTESLLTTNLIYGRLHILQLKVNDIIPILTYKTGSTCKTRLNEALP